MIILHIDEQRGWRGGEQQASYLIRGLGARGHQVLLAGRQGSPFLTRDHGVPITEKVPAPFLGEWDLWTAYRLATAVKRYRVDILHAHTSHSHTLACLARGIAGRGKVVVSRRVDFAPKASSFNRWKYRVPDRIIAISDCIAAVLRESGVPDSRLATVHSAVDPQRVDVAPVDRKTLGLKDEDRVILNVAALVGHKDHATLLDAMAKVVELIPQAHLFIAGEGPLRPALIRQMEALGVAANVHLLGYRNDVPALLKAADVFVLSSKQEGLGTAVLDAMAARVPVVATAGGGIPEMVVHEDSGLLVPVQDPDALGAALIRTLKDEELRRALAEGAWLRLEERFTVDRMIEGNLAVYRSVLGKKEG